jgi:hypothetical protein
LTGYGLQTQEFIRRLKALEDSLPPLLLELAEVMRRMVEEIEAPQLEDIQRLQAELKRVVGDPGRLRAICGLDGEFCGQCPFGAYLPSGFPYSFEAQAICLPWIAVVHFPSGA